MTHSAMSIDENHYKLFNNGYPCEMKNLRGTLH